MAGGRRHVLSRKMPRSSGMVLLPASRCSRAEASTPSGWVPRCGCSSCCGSPRRTTLFGGLGHGEDVGEGGLAGLVHEEDVDGAGVLLARPEPGRAGADLGGAVVERGEDAGVVGDFVDAGDGRVGLLVAVLIFWTQGIGDLLLARRLRRTSSRRFRMTLWLTAETPTFRPASDAVDDHPRAGVGLPRSGRALDGEDGAVEGEDGALGEVDRRLRPSPARTRPSSGAGDCRGGGRGRRTSG